MQYELTTFIQPLTFTWPKAGHEVGPLNWTQEHKRLRRSRSEGYGPRPQARARLARADVVQRADRRPFRSPVLVARADFLKIGHFAPFSQSLHIKGLNFPHVFLSVQVYL